MGAWIETGSLRCEAVVGWSHPTWVRGLKRSVPSVRERPPVVAPYVGAWIETYDRYVTDDPDTVAPYVGAWIETSQKCYVG